MRVKTIFVSSEKSNCANELQVYANSNDEIYIGINVPEEPYINAYSWICLDKKTAIQLSRVLRREISFLKDGEVDNG
jgi:hypothetical protein